MSRPARPHLLLPFPSSLPTVSCVGNPTCGISSCTTSIKIQNIFPTRHSSVVKGHLLESCKARPLPGSAHPQPILPHALPLCAPAVLTCWVGSKMPAGDPTEPPIALTRARQPSPKQACTDLWTLDKEALNGQGENVYSELRKTSGNCSHMG